jgi:serine/threonine protein kinase
MPRPADHERIPDPVPPLPLPEFDYDDIEKTERIGTGGDADVYLGTVEHQGNKYEVAIKEPRFEGTIQRRVVEKFQNEAETWNSLSDHENIVSVYGWGTKPLPWMGLEYMDGGTLSNRIGSLDVPEALWLAGRIAEGIRYGHRHGIAHLDIKPANVLLRDTPAGKWDYPKVSDWGLAKMLLEHSNSIEGISPTYAAPEQFDREVFGSPDDFTDIYQLGTLVYAMLAGEPPFTGTSTAVMRSVIDDQPDHPSAVNPDLPEAVDDVVLRALAKKKDDRYESVVTFRQDLDRLFEELIESTTSDTAVRADQSTGTSESAGMRTRSGETSHKQSGGIQRRRLLGFSLDSETQQATETRERRQSDKQTASSDRSEATQQTSREGSNRSSQSRSTDLDRKSTNSTSRWDQGPLQNTELFAAAGVAVVVVLLGVGLVIGGVGPFSNSFDSTNPGQIELGDITVPDDIMINEEFTVTVEVNNTGSTVVSDNITISSTPISDEIGITVLSNDKETIEFTGNAEEPGNYPLRVSSSTDEKNRTLRVYNGPDIRLASLEIENSVDPDENFTAEVEVVNNGDREGSKTIVVSNDSVGIRGQRTVNIGPGATRVISVEIDTEGIEPGRYTMSAGIADDELESLQTDQITINEVPRFSITGIDAPDTVDQGSLFDINVIVNNTGGAAGTQEIELIKDGAPLERKELELGPGEQGVISFEAEIGETTTFEVITNDDARPVEIGLNSTDSN